MAEIKLNGKPFADFKTRKMIGHAVADDIDITFEFKVYPKADEDDIFSAMVETFIEKFEMYFEEFENNG